MFACARAPIQLVSTKSPLKSLLSAYSIRASTLPRSFTRLRLIKFNKIHNTPIKEPNTSSKATSTTATTVAEQQAVNATSLSIFKRFKEAYKAQGKVLIYCHIVTCCGWMVGFYFLSKSGYDLGKVLGLLNKLKIMSVETKESILKKIETFEIESFLRGYHFDYVLSDRIIDSIKANLTGETLKHILTAIVLYKIFTPLRYALTLSVTKLLIEFYKKTGYIPKTPPPGYSIKEMYLEKKLFYQKRLQNQQERLRNSKTLTRVNLARNKLERGRFWTKKKDL